MPLLMKDLGRACLTLWTGSWAGAREDCWSRPAIGADYLQPHRPMLDGFLMTATTSTVSLSLIAFACTVHGAVSGAGPIGDSLTSSSVMPRPFGPRISEYP